MSNILFDKSANGKESFFIDDNGERVAEMVVGIKQKEISVFHTEVANKLEGKGVGKQLIDAMVEHAKTNDLKVIPICSYVKAQFSKDPEKYVQVWDENQ